MAIAEVVGRLQQGQRSFGRDGEHGFGFGFNLGQLAGFRLQPVTIMEGGASGQVQENGLAFGAGKGMARSRPVFCREGQSNLSKSGGRGQ